MEKKDERKGTYRGSNNKGRKHEKTPEDINDDEIGQINMIPMIVTMIVLLQQTMMIMITTTNKKLPQRRRRRQYNDNGDDDDDGDASLLSSLKSSRRLMPTSSSFRITWGNLCPYNNIMHVLAGNLDWFTRQIERTISEYSTTSTKG